MNATSQGWQLGKACQAVGNGSSAAPVTLWEPLCQPAVTLALGFTEQAAERVWLGVSFVFL